MTEVLDPPLTVPVSAALGAVSAAFEQLSAATTTGSDAGLWTLSSPELLDATADLHRLLSQGDAVMHALVREVDARGAAVEAGARRTEAWLSARLRLHPGAAKRLVATSRALHDDPAGPLVRHADADGAADNARTGLAGLRAAFATGDISAEHVQVATDALRAVAPRVTADVARQAEEFLVEQALTHHPKSLAAIGRHLRHVLDPDAGDRLADEEEHEAATRTLEIRDKRNGGSHIVGDLDRELTAALRAQLSPLAAPRPAVDGVKDPRSVGQRNADALAELLRRIAGTDDAPLRRGERATVTVTVALETLERRLGAPGAWLDWSGCVSAETARRLACDAQVIPVVLGSNGEPLDVGRASYPVTAAIWRALVARDRGCAFAGCNLPPEWCDAHHIWHWVDGGPTSVTNMSLLCAAHHRAVHHHGWELRLLDGQILTVPPPWVDPARSPRRNTGRDLHADVGSLMPHDVRSCSTREGEPIRLDTHGDPDPPDDG